MIIDHSYFLKEFHSFREILESTNYTVEQKQDAYTGLIRVYMNVERDNDENEELRKSAIGMLQVEVPLRLGYEMTSEIMGPLKETTP